jgi:hypothetical protein
MASGGQSQCCGQESCCKGMHVVTLCAPLNSHSHFPAHITGCVRARVWYYTVWQADSSSDSSSSDDEPAVKPVAKPAVAAKAAKTAAPVAKAAAKKVCVCVCVCICVWMSTD